MRPRWQRTTRRDVHTVDVTAFLSLMVILVPFLLVTAVFTRMTILELQPTGGEGIQTPAQDPLQLRVIVRADTIEVNHLGLAQPMRIDRSTDASAVAELATLAGNLKARYPQSQEATILLEPQIHYDLLVQVLDALRIRLQQHEGTAEPEPLFPQIALGLMPTTEQPEWAAP